MFFFSNQNTELRSWSKTTYILNTKVLSSSLVTLFLNFSFFLRYTELIMVKMYLTAAVCLLFVTMQTVMSIPSHRRMAKMSLTSMAMGGAADVSDSSAVCEDQRSIYCTFMRSCFSTTFLMRCQNDEYLRSTCSLSCKVCQG